MVIFAFATLLFGVFLGRFMTAYSIAPGCCFAIIVDLAVVNMPPLALVVRLLALVDRAARLPGGAGSTGLPTIRKARRQDAHSAQPVRSPQDGQAAIVAGGRQTAGLNAHSPQRLSVRARPRYASRASNRKVFS